MPRLKPRQILILDTTLRDGQQAPGASMPQKKQIAYAQHAHNLGIDVLDAGFPSSSKTHFESVHTITRDLTLQHSPMTICALCQLREDQLLTTMKALLPAVATNKAQVYCYVPISPALMHASLGKLAQDKKTIINRITRLFSMAYQSGFSIQFALEGFSEIGPNVDFGLDLCRAAIDAGASVITCPDTIGSASHWQGKRYFVNIMNQFASQLKSEFPEHDILWSAHCHNDLGLALENTLQSVFNGPARQIEGCINGVGERAGNVAIEQCIMALKKYGSSTEKKYNFFTNARPHYLKVISDFVADNMLIRQPHQPIVGDNIARHSSGGHTRALLNDPNVYHAFSPNEVGQTMRLTFGPLSGSNHMQAVLQSNGFFCHTKDKATLTQFIKKKHGDEQKHINDEDIISAHHEFYAPIQCHSISYKRCTETHTTLQLNGQFFHHNHCELSSTSNEAPLTLLNQTVNKHFPTIEIENLSSQTCKDTKANGRYRSTVIIQHNQSSYIGKANDNDLILATITAYINAVNLAYINQHYRLEKQQN